MGKLLNSMRAGRDERFARLHGVLPFLAMGCARCWVALTVAAPVAGPYESPASMIDFHNVFDYAFCLTALIVALAARRFVPLNGTARFRNLSFAGFAGSSLCFVAAHVFGLGSSTPLAVAGSALGGFGFALFLLLAAEVIASLPLLRIFLFSTLSQLAAAALTFFLSGLDEPRMLVAVLLLPIAARIAVARAYAGLPDQDKLARPCSKFTYPWKIFVLMALYSFVYGLRQSQLVAGAGQHTGASTAIMMGVLFLSAYFFSNRFNIGTLYRSPLVLIICGFLLIPAEGIFGNVVSSYLIAMSYSLTSLLVALLFYDISKRLGVTIVVFSGIKNAEQIFVVMGKGASNALDSVGLTSGAQDIVIAVLVAVMMLVATLILLSERELASKWGVRILDVGGLVERTPEEERRDEMVEALASRARLTPRETEIVALVAQGRNGPAIMAELFIAEGTLKAHMSHIYEKCGVANRRELKELLEG